MQLSRLVVVLAPISIGLIFATTLVGIDRLGFRDVSHFYTPLYDYVAARGAEQWIPLWNPLDATGMPLLGETTTAFFYPPRYLLFSLPLATETAMAWYVTLHLILAAFLARAAARRCGIGWTGATVASIVYPLSGTVLFLATNPPYLVGAAWLPLLMTALIAPNFPRTRQRVLCGSVAMAMMILGGDPQLALHAMILATIVYAARRLRTNTFAERKTRTPGRVIILVPAIASLLAAPQLATSLAWSRQSDRVHRDQAASWTEPPVAGSKRSIAFQYSFPPWHLAELAAPLPYGSLLPVHQRYSLAWPGDGRMWTPTIYMGVATLLAVLAHFLQRRQWDAWLACGILSLLLATGHFGLVYWVQNTTGMLEQYDSAIGGLYWWLYQLVPGYSSFRYPAKWLTPLAFCLAMITGLGIDRLPGVPARRLRQMFIAVTAALSVALLASLVLHGFPEWVVSNANQPRDPFWGPLQISAGLSDLTRSLVHALLAIVALMWTVTKYRADPQRYGVFLVCVIAFDVTLCGYGLIPRVPRQAEQQLLQAISQDDVSAKRWMRTRSGSTWPQQWASTSDSDRLLEVEASGRASWFGRWHLLQRAAVLNNMVSIRSAAMASFWQAAQIAMRDLNQEQRVTAWKGIQDWLAIDGVIQTGGEAIVVQQDSTTATVASVERFRTGQAKPHRVLWQWKFADAWPLDAETLASRLKQMTSGQGVARVRRSARVRASDHVEFDQVDQSPGKAEVRRLAHTAESETVEIKVNRTALLTRPVLQDGHWHAWIASVRDQEATEQRAVLAVDNLTQGIIIPRGHWRVHFYYAPWWFKPSCVLAIIAWVMWLLFAARETTTLDGRVLRSEESTA